MESIGALTSTLMMVMMIVALMPVRAPAHPHRQHHHPKQQQQHHHQQKHYKNATELKRQVHEAAEKVKRNGVPDAVVAYKQRHSPKCSDKFFCLAEEALRDIDDSLTRLEYSLDQYNKERNSTCTKPHHPYVSLSILLEDIIDCSGIDS